ncbi:hypothetical protein SAMN05660443_1919 [Marinospirillum celere]|uniref:Uncharacterized protein n=1 Tax=Marinospirillum celere TaxID=1122252 RepID=A0A1I1HJX6_9GAMM|nr:hypothetical protein [Marinospirillum celere]SFC21390.1 hypothetical protein SAMN05660443_1919 [Marinospirillum celere]
MDTKPSASVHWSMQLNAFHRQVQLCRHLQQWRVLAYTGLILSLSNLVFILLMSPRSWLLIALPLVILPFFFVLAPVLGMLLRRVEKKRNQLARAFFMAGLRVDEAGRLTTNTAHPRVISEPSEVKQRSGLAV